VSFNLGERERFRREGLKVKEIHGGTKGWGGYEDIKAGKEKEPPLKKKKKRTSDEKKVQILPMGESDRC